MISQLMPWLLDTLSGIRLVPSFGINQGTGNSFPTTVQLGQFSHNLVGNTFEAIDSQFIEGSRM